MNRRALLGVLIAGWLGLLLVGTWILNRGSLAGVLVIIISVLGFVITFASSFPQSTLHARDD